ncbi:hypothetical protein DCO56_10575 [Sphingobacterium athyrii]|uniref:Uncharacterized protein n=1 Tax=Sphingobacterium athyrii TaxID=2152717 RepID=A0A363NSV1_9SPHI|nr:hypothetical protein DCO56_10575 [Sphingobacterium athyrii]
MIHLLSERQYTDLGDRLIKASIIMYPIKPIKLISKIFKIIFTTLVALETGWFALAIVFLLFPVHTFLMDA